MRRDAETGRRLDELLRSAEKHLDQLESAIDGWRGAGAVAARAESPAPAESTAPADAPEAGGESYLLFLPSPSGYDLVERSGRVPAVGESVSLDGIDTRYLVVKVERSPLPDDRRRCAYLELT